MLFLGSLASIFIGVSLGMVGGGGSILTVPILVYLFSVPVVLATSYSLWIVGFTSLIWGIKYAQNGMVHLKRVIVFGIPAVIGVFATRRWVLPNMPDIHFGNIIITKDIILLFVFAILMVMASYSMIRKQKKVEKWDNIKYGFLILIIEGIVTGAITGLVGAGGGFLIIPALVMIEKMPMKEAIGTSLFIIAMKSLIGFFAEIWSLEIDWYFLINITLLTTLGIFFGQIFAKKISGDALKPIFWWFVLVLGSLILTKEIIALF